MAPVILAWLFASPSPALAGAEGPQPPPAAQEHGKERPAAERPAAERPAVGRLLITGNRAVATAAIEAVLRLRPHGWFRSPPAFDPAVLEEDLARVQELYRRRGYYDVAIGTALQEQDGRVDVTLTVQEGEPVRVAELACRCDDCPDWLRTGDGDAVTDHGVTTSPRPRDQIQDAGVALDRLLPDPPLRPGDVFAIDAYEAMKRELVRALADLGYAKATVQGKAQVYRQEHQADVTFHLRAGSRYRLGAITVAGNERLAGPLVRRELSLRPGEVFSFSRIVADEKHLRRLDLFRRVAIRPDWGRAAADVVPLRVQVEEKPPRGLKLGAGYGTEEGLRALAELRWRNFLHRGYTASMEGRLTSLGHRFRLLFENPWLLGRRNLRFSAEFGSRLQNVESFRNRQLYLRLAVQRPWLRHWQLLLAQNLERNQTSDVDPATMAAAVQRFGRVEEESFTVSSLEAGVAFRRLDDPLDPLRGEVVDYRLEGGLGVLGGAFEFLRQEISARLFRPLSAGLGVVGRVRVGSVDPFRQGDYVPISKRFFAGGARSLRGYAFQDVGDKDTGGNPLGGLSLFEASVELRLRFSPRIRGVLFLDSGNVFPDPYRVDGSNLRYSAGVGIRYRTPIGPVSVDLGHKLNPAAASGSRLRLHVNLGRTF